MKIVDDALVRSCRGAGRCEVCGKHCRVREGAHIFAAGHGGGNRIDVSWNIVVVGSTPNFCCPCHTLHHDGKSPTRDELMKVVAMRDGIRPASIEDGVRWLQNLPKLLMAERIESRLLELTIEPRQLCRSVLLKHGVLK